MKNQKPIRYNCDECGSKVTEDTWWIHIWDKEKKRCTVMCKKCFELSKIKLTIQ